MAREVEPADAQGKIPGGGYAQSLDGEGQGAGPTAQGGVPVGHVPMALSSL